MFYVFMLCLRFMSPYVTWFGLSGVLLACPNTCVVIHHAKALVTCLQERTADDVSSTQSPSGAFADVSTSKQMYDMQQQIDFVGSSIQLLRNDISSMAQSAAIAQASNGHGGNGDGNGLTPGSSSEDARAIGYDPEPTSQYLEETRQALVGLQQVCSDLSHQVDQMSNHVSDQVLARVSELLLDSTATPAAASPAVSLDEVKDSLEQLISFNMQQLNGQLTGELSALRSDLNMQLQGMESRLDRAEEAATNSSASASSFPANGSYNPDLNPNPQGMVGNFGGMGDSQPAGFDQEASFADWESRGSDPSGPAGNADLTGSFSNDNYDAQPPVGYGQQGLSQPSSSNSSISAAMPAGPGATTQGFNSPDSMMQYPPTERFPVPPPSEVAYAGMSGQRDTFATAQAPALPNSRVQFPPSAFDPSMPMMAPAAPPQLPAVPDVGSLAPETLIPEGLQLLRSGREAARGQGPWGGLNYAAAEVLIQAAIGCFQRACELDPKDARAKGNLGNALLAQGELKRMLFDELRATGAAAGRDGGIVQVAEMRLR